MLQTLVSTENMTNEEWLQWRLKGIGGSDASIVCGINKYKSAFQLWMEKLGTVTADEHGEACFWGHVMEPIIREEFTKRTGIEVQIVQAILQHPDYPFMFANVDGIIEDAEHGNCIFEAKTASVYLADQWEEGIPEAYLLQVQHYMAVTGFDGTYVAVLIGGNQFKWKFIERDEELINMLIELEADFWWHVENKIPPPVDGSEACTALLNRLFPTGQPRQLILPDDAINLISEYELYQEQEKNATLSKDRVANSLKMMLGDNEIGVIGERAVSWKSVNSFRLDTNQLKAEQPKIFDEYKKHISSRRFTVK